MSHCGNLILKVDIAKAFDTLNWNFIFKDLNSFGFNSKFCGWIEVVLKSVKVSILVNSKQ